MWIFKTSQISIHQLDEVILPENKALLLPYVRLQRKNKFAKNILKIKYIIIINIYNWYYSKRRCRMHPQYTASSIVKHVCEHLHNSFPHVIKTINKIRNISLNDRLFQQLCIKSHKEYNRFLLYREVRRVSKGACLHRLY